MCPLIERWLGHERPKQYCSFYGSKSLLEYTLERAFQIVGGQRIVTVIGQGHRTYLPKSRVPFGRILEQPVARGTGPGVLLPLTYVRATDPDATVVIMPSDHFISPDGPFLQVINDAKELLDSIDDQMVLIGVPPDGPEPEYGWIEPGAKTSCHLPLDARSVNDFIEKPSPSEALHCYGCGYFWNTMIVVARIRTIWSLAESVHPKAVGRFERLQEGFSAIADGFLSRKAESLLLPETYSDMPEFDFSRDFLTPCARNCLIVPLKDVIWNDLGRPERLLQVLEETDCSSNLPLSLLKPTEQRA